MTRQQMIEHLRGLGYMMFADTIVAEAAVYGVAEAGLWTITSDGFGHYKIK